METIGQGMEKIEQVYGDVEETLWGQCGFLACMEAILLALGFVGAFHHKSAWIVLVWSFVMIMVGFLWSCCFASSKGARKTPGSWKLHKTREVLQCFVAVIIATAIGWILLQTSSSRSYYLEIEIPSFTDGSIIQWKAPEYYAWWIGEEVYPVLDEWMEKDEGLQLKFVKAADYESSLSIYGTGSVAGGTLFRAKRENPEIQEMAEKQFYLYPESGNMTPSSRYNVTSAKQVIFEIMTDEMAEETSMWIQDSTSQYVNAIDVVMDLIMMTCLPMPAFLVAAACDCFCLESWKQKTGKTMTVLIIAIITTWACLWGLFAEHGCSGGCYVFLVMIIVFVGSVSAACALRYFRANPYPGPTDQHDGIDLMGCNCQVPEFGRP